MASQLFNAVSRNVARRGWLELFEQQAVLDDDRRSVTKQHNQANHRTSLRQAALYQRDTTSQTNAARSSTKVQPSQVNSIGIALAHYRLKHAGQTP